MARISGLKLCSLLWICFQSSQWVHGILFSEAHVNRSSAQQQCEQYGGLLSYEIFIKENASDSLKESYQQIEDGESAWVSELVNYSQFVSWHGCYLKDAVNVTGGTSIFNMTGKSVSSCFSPCNKTKPLLYVGISWDRRNRYLCYCVPKDHLNKRLAYTVKLFNGSAMLDVCNDTQPTINVYKLHDNKQIPVIRSYGQCEYVYKITQGTNYTIEYGTRSCLSYLNGYICIKSSLNMLKTESCISQDSNKTHCIMNTSVNWYDAQIECNRVNARLVDEIIPVEIEKQMQTNVTYWTGLFREFKIIPSSAEISEEDVCLSVRVNSTKFALEPAECSDVKLMLCQSKNNSSEILNDKTVTFETDRNNKTSNVYENSGTNLTISLTFNGVLILIIVCLAIVLYRRSGKPDPTLYSLKCEKGTTTTRSTDTLADDSVFNAVDSDEYHDGSHHYACPDNTAIGTGRHENKYDNPHDSGAKQYDHNCLRNASHQNVGLSENINVSDYSHINASQQHGGHGDNVNVSDNSHVNSLAKVTASNQTMYEEIKVQTLDRKTETEL